MKRFSLPRSEAVVRADGTRHCAARGDFIDPIDWCDACQRSNAAGNGACRTLHRRLRKRADAAYCNTRCRNWDRATYARDCLPLEAADALPPADPLAATEDQPPNT